MSWGSSQVTVRAGAAQMQSLVRRVLSFAGHGHFESALQLINAVDGTQPPAAACDAPTSDLHSNVTWPAQQQPGRYVLGFSWGYFPLCFVCAKSGNFASLCA